MMHNVNDLAVLIFEKTYWTKNPYRSPLVEIKPSFKTAMKNVEESFHIMRDLDNSPPVQAAKKFVSLYFRQFIQNRRI